MKNFKQEYASRQRIASELGQGFAETTNGLSSRTLACRGSNYNG